MSEFPEQIYRSTTSSILRAWREHGGRYRLEGTKCRNCEQIWFPRRSVCGKCNSTDLEAYACAQTGEIEESYVLYLPILTMLGHSEQQPRIPVIVKLDDGLHVLSEVIDVENPDDVIKGMRVKMVLRKQKRESNSNWMYAYKFTPYK